MGSLSEQYVPQPGSFLVLVKISILSSDKRNKNVTIFKAFCFFPTNFENVEAPIISYLSMDNGQKISERINIFERFDKTFV